VSAAFGSILVPLTGSALAEQALPVGAAIARRAGVPLHLVSVAEPMPAMVVAEVEYAQELGREAREDLCRYLSSALERTRESQRFPVRGEVIDGDAAEALAGYVAREHIGLVVMTSHARAGFTRRWLGGVADGLLRRTSAPVLLLHPRETAQPDRYPRIQVALDGQRDEAVLAAALGLGSLTSAESYLLTRVVPDSVPIMSPLSAYPTGHHPDWALQQAIEARNALARLASRVDFHGCRVTTQVVPAEDVSRALLEVARVSDVDLIVVGTHRAGGLERLILGSVAEKVIRAASQPVLVVPPRGPGSGSRVRSATR
jgi:nucleotide-binding universal stress UspA family protein